MRISLIASLSILLLISSCRKRSPEELKAREASQFKINLALEKDGNIMSVVETPAGSHEILEYNKKNHQFEINKSGSKDHITYLTTPFNLGFIPSTYQDPVRGGNGQTLKVIILSSSIQSEAYTPVDPIGVMFVNNNGLQEKYILATSLDKSKQTIDVQDISQLPKGALEIISTWICHSRGSDRLQLNKWGRKREALNLINTWKIK